MPPIVSGRMLITAARLGAAHATERLEHRSGHWRVCAPHPDQRPSLRRCRGFVLGALPRTGGPRT